MINVCVIKPKNYIHYLAFKEIAELIYFSSKDLNINAQISFNFFDPDPSNINILIGAHLLNDNLLDSLPLNTIIFNTEQIESINDNWKKRIISLSSKKITFWDYSNYNLEYLFKKNNIEGKLFNIGYQKELNRIKPSTDKDIDVLFYGSINPRRKYIIDKLIENKIKVKTVFGVYEKERDKLIANSKIVLNMHMYDSKIFEIIRVFYLLTNGITVVSEVGSDTKSNNKYLDSICACEYEQICEKIIYLIENDKERKEIGMKGLDTIKKFPQSLFTKEILDNKI